MWCTWNLTANNPQEISDAMITYTICKKTSGKRYKSETNNEDKSARFFDASQDERIAKDNSLTINWWNVIQKFPMKFVITSQMQTRLPKIYIQKEVINRRGKADTDRSKQRSMSIVTLWAATRNPELRHIPLISPWDLGPHRCRLPLDPEHEH